MEAREFTFAFVCVRGGGRGECVCYDCVTDAEFESTGVGNPPLSLSLSLSLPSGGRSWYVQEEGV